MDVHFITRYQKNQPLPRKVAALPSEDPVRGDPLDIVPAGVIP
jgi:hypothetical protein